MVTVSAFPELFLASALAGGVARFAIARRAWQVFPRRAAASAVTLVRRSDSFQVPYVLATRAHTCILLALLVALGAWSIHE